MKPVVERIFQSVPSQIREHRRLAYNRSNITGETTVFLSFYFKTPAV